MFVNDPFTPPTHSLFVGQIATLLEKVPISHVWRVVREVQHYSNRVCNRRRGVSHTPGIVRFPLLLNAGVLGTSIEGCWKDAVLPRRGWACGALPSAFVLPAADDVRERERKEAMWKEDLLLWAFRCAGFFQSQTEGLEGQG